MARLRLLAATALAALVPLGATPAAVADGPASTIDSVRPSATGLAVEVKATGLAEGVDLDAATVTVRLADRHVDATVSSQQPVAADGPSRSVALLVDTSGSMAGVKLAAAQRASQAYLDAVPDDVLVSLVTFSSQPVVVAAPSTDRGRVSAALPGLVAQGKTSLHDAVLQGVDLVRGADERRILVLSDGEDSASAATLEGAMSALATADVTADAVVHGDYAAGIESLTRLTAARGGRLLHADGVDATDAFVAAARAFDAKLFLDVPVIGDAGSGPVRLVVDVTTTDGTRLRAERDVLLPQRLGGGVSRLSSPAVVIGLLLVFVGLVAVLLFAFRVGGSAASPRQRRDALLASYTAATSLRTSPAQESSPIGTGGPARLALAVTDRIAAVGGLGKRLEQRLDAAAVRLTAAEWLVVHLTVTTIALLVLLLLGNSFLAVLGGPMAAFAPHAWLSTKASRRRAAFVENMPDALQLVAGGLSTGYSLPQALDSVVREGQEPVASEFGRALAESRLGVPVEDALEGVADRMGSEDFRWVVMAIRVQRDVGGNLAEVLQTVCHTMRERAALRRQVQALSAEGRMSALILILLPVLVALYLALTSGDFFRPMYETGIGIALLGFSAVSLALGAFWMMKLIKVEM